MSCTTSTAGPSSDNVTDLLQTGRRTLSSARLRAAKLIPAAVAFITIALLGGCMLRLWWRLVRMARAADVSMITPAPSKAVGGGGGDGDDEGGGALATEGQDSVEGATWPELESSNPMKGRIMATSFSASAPASEMPMKDRPSVRV